MIMTLIDAAELPDGPVDIPGVTQFGNSPSRIAAGRWVHNNPEWVAPGSYLQFETAGTARRVGCTALFRSAGSRIALLTPTQDWSTQPSAEWAASVHFVAGPKTWKATYFANRTTEPLFARGIFLRPLRLGVPHRFELAINGDELTVNLPNGKSKTTRHELIRETASLATVELFTVSKDIAPAELTSFWAE